MHQSAWFHVEVTDHPMQTSLVLTKASTRPGQCITRTPTVVGIRCRSSSMYMMHKPNVPCGVMSQEPEASRVGAVLCEQQRFGATSEVI